MCKRGLLFTQKYLTLFHSLQEGFQRLKMSQRDHHSFNGPKMGCMGVCLDLLLGKMLQVQILQRLGVIESLQLGSCTRSPLYSEFKICGFEANGVISTKLPDANMTTSS